MPKGGVKGHKVNPKSLENLQQKPANVPAAPREEMAQRIIELLRDGKTAKQITEELKPQIDETAKTLLPRAFKRAYEILRDETKSMAKNVGALQFARAELLWQKAMDEGKYSLALDVLKEINRMCGNTIQNMVTVVNTTDEDNKPRLNIQIIQNNTEDESRNSISEEL